MATSTTVRPMGWLVLPCRVVLGGLFIVAGVMKLRDPQGFAEAIAAFKLIPERADYLTVFTAFAMPWIELLAGAFLVIGLWARASALLIGALLVAFIVMIASVLIRIKMGVQLSVSCTCFGELEWPCGETLGMCQIWRDVVLLAMAVPVLVWGPGPLAIDRESTR
ncbi:MAG TPA: DoxX family protein [Phycisphaerales bacterium]|nr:DoxX family protein [Phycisphaerales bacterium]